ncbi:hypothetical protein F443_00714 [Phytophthora nicotianae P1569]|uniref:Uncharacterized protein n=1 Tax=Phytophthora nicotianae P1569 TaxID=1317065 RepID=V9G2D1_PHYNI|nr:hypothetical protein F443_00714 [Phytophthora nicotianae P1569]
MEAGQGEASPPVPPAEGTQDSPSSDEESASEYVDSSDSNWSGGSVVDSITLDDDYETQESCEEVEVSEDDLSVHLVDESIAAKARRSGRLLRQQMLRGPRVGCRALADNAKPSRGHGVREKFPYVLPLVGQAKHIQEERVDAPSFVDQLQKLWKPLKKRGAQRLNEKKKPCF